MRDEPEGFPSYPGSPGHPRLTALPNEADGRDEPEQSRLGSDAERMLTETDSYDQLYRDFRWDIPARFNIAAACCDRHADGSGRLALIYVDEDGSAKRTSFDALRDLSSRFANALKSDGLARGDRVAVFLSQSLELPVAHLAAFRSGLVSVPLFTLFGEDALQFRLQNSGAKAIVTDEGGWEKLAKIRDRLPDLKTVYVTGQARAGAKSFWGEIEKASDDFPVVDTSCDDPAIIIYTSGTTGNPKGALHAHRVLLGHLPNIEMVHGFFPKPGDVMWTPADWAWIGGLFDALFPALYHGVPVVGYRAKKFDADAAMQLMADHGVRVRVPAADRAEADAAGRRQASGRQAAQHALRRRVARRRTARLGARHLRHRGARDLRADRMQSRGRLQFEAVSDPSGCDGQGDAGLRRAHRQ